MKFLTLIIVGIIACNSPKVDNEADYTVDEIDTTKALQNELPSIKKNGKKSISQNEKILNEAVVISSDFYNNLKVQNYAAANKDMHPDGLSVTPVNEWINIYKKAQNKTGPLGYVKMIDHGVKCKLKGGNGMGDYAELVFEAQYRDGNLREKLIFFRKDSTDAVKILGYEYNQIADRVVLTEELREK